MDSDAGLSVSPGPMPRRWTLANAVTLAAGLMQALLAFSLLFLPVFTMCLEQAGRSLLCRRETYSEQGGSLIGYTFLALLLLTGIVAVVASLRASAQTVCLARWLVIVVSAVFVVLGAWSIGLLFAPGALLMLPSALACRRHPAV